jgi:ribose/xylose/arabinose/galactoside ABC-type transport system permease subunit
MSHPCNPPDPPSARSFSALLFILEHLPWLVALLILGVMAAVSPAFRSSVYWANLAQQYFAPAVLALALTPIVLTGGIDLSVGSVAVFSSVIAGVLLRDAGCPLPVALAAGAAAGLFAGLVNGSLAVLGVVPLVATLATRELFRGLALSIGGDTTASGLSDSVGNIWRTRILGLPPPVLIGAVVFVVTYLVVHHTWIGRMLYAVGDNETAARFAGLPVQRLKLAIYAACGLAAGICGCAIVLRFGSASATAEKSLELTAIACVVLGGVRVTGGVGHVGGTLLGVVTVAVLLAGLSTVPPTGRDTVLGALVILVAVCNEAARRTADRLHAAR